MYNYTDMNKLILYILYFQRSINSINLHSNIIVELCLCIITM